MLIKFQHLYKLITRKTQLTISRMDVAVYVFLQFVFLAGKTSELNSVILLQLK